MLEFSTCLIWNIAAIVHVCNSHVICKKCVQQPRRVQKNMKTALQCAEEHVCNSPAMCRRIFLQQPCRVQKDVCAVVMLCIEEHCATAMSCTEAHEEPCHVLKYMCLHPHALTPFSLLLEGPEPRCRVRELVDMYHLLLVLNALNSCAPVSAITHANEQLLCSAVAQWSSQAAL